MIKIKTAALYQGDCMELMKTYPEIQEQGDGVMTGLQRELGLDALAPPREIARAMLRKDRTLAERVSALERRMDRVEKVVGIQEPETRPGRGENNRN